MKLAPFSVSRMLKRLAPKSLFARSLLILVLPVLLIQLVAAYVFYERHWASVSRQMSSSLAGEIAWLVDRWDATQTTVGRQRLLAYGRHYMGINVKVQEPMQIDTNLRTRKLRFASFERILRERLERPVALRHVPSKDNVYILIPADGAMLQIEVPEKRLISSTNLIFTSWMLGASLAVIIIAVLFLRNQIRPIVQLAEAAERFGKGQDLQGFRPGGAREVRKAARAFIDMRDRIQRTVESRTAMLAGISHDLRTPLTRMKLQLEMLGGQEGAVKELQQDLAEMGHMIEAYLNFARGEGSEKAQKLSLVGWLEEVISAYARTGKKVTLQEVPAQPVTLKPQAMKRVLQNLIDNALRYGKECWVGAEIRRHRLTLTVEDDGPGIPIAERENVFQAFRRLEPSRNISTGGAGLGLTIVRDIVHSHGGEVILDTSSHGGLKAVIHLPI